jgi:hypothetical protein
MVWADIDPEFEADYNRWYDEEHIDRLLAIPGFLSAGRYEALKGGPKYLALYELEAADVLRSPAFLEGVRFRPSARRAQASGGTIGRNYLLNGYRQIFPVHTNPIEQTRGPAPFLQMGRIDIPAMVEEEFNDWYNTAYIPPYAAVPGCLGARRYVAIDGQPKYLTLYEFANATVSESAEWARARDSNPWSNRIRAFMRHDVGSPGVYARIYPK